MMQRFTVYRPAVPSTTHNADQVNPPDQPQFEGVVFSDGRVALRWLTDARSVSVWDSLEDMLKIHGHPEYGTYFVWHDGDGWAPIEAAPRDGTPIRVRYMSRFDGEEHPAHEVHWGTPPGWTQATWVGGTKEFPQSWTASLVTQWQPLTGRRLNESPLA